MRLKVDQSKAAVFVPAASLRYAPQGVEVAAVEGERISIQSVVLGRDSGKTVEVVSGLTGNKQLVANPS